MSTFEDEYEKELERQLEEIDKQTEEVSKAIGNEPEDEPEIETQEPEVSTDEPEEDVPAVDDAVKPDDPDGDGEQVETESKDDGDDTTSKASIDDEQPTVPISRLSEVVREKRKLEKQLRESNDKTQEYEAQLADQTATIESLQRQAEQQGVVLSDSSKGFTEDDFESLSQEFGDTNARTLIDNQKALNKALGLLEEVGKRKQQPDPADDSDQLMDAIVENDDAHGWFLANGENWQRMKALWAENQATLDSDFDTDQERVNHIVGLMKQKPADPEPREKPRPTRSLSDAGGDPGNGGDVVDQYLAMGNRAIDKLEKLEQSDPIEYERVLDAMRARREKS